MKNKEALIRAFASADEHDLAEAIRAMMAHRATRRFLWFILERGNAYGNPNPFSPDTYTTAFNCGIMATGQAILAKIIEVDPEIPLRLMQEHQNERNERDAQLRNADAPGGDAGYEDTLDGDDPARGDFYRGEERRRERIRAEI